MKPGRRLGGWGCLRAGVWLGWLLVLVLGGAGCAVPGGGTANAPAGTGSRTGQPGMALDPEPDAATAEALVGWEVLCTQRIQSHWSDLLADALMDGPPGGGYVEVDCAVDGRGRLVRVGIVRSTVDDVLARYCVRAVRDRSPLPAPPTPGGHAWRITFVYEHARRGRSRGG